MKKYFYLAGLGLLLSSCGGESTPGGDSDSTKTDTVAALPANSAIDPALLAKFTVSTAIPFAQDSAYLASMILNDTNKLTADELRYLSYGFVDTEVSYEGLIPVEDALFFDSLKADGSYDGYIETADIGMMIRSEAHVAQKVKVDDSTDVLLWVVDFGTYEACPYASGKILYGSVLRNGVVTSTTILGEDSGGADAPVWSTTVSLVSMTSNGITVFKTDQNCAGEADEEGNEAVDVSTLDFILSIDENGVWKQEPIVVTEEPL
jgi:hypothetical protein